MKNIFFLFLVISSFFCITKNIFANDIFYQVTPGFTADAPPVPGRVVKYISLQINYDSGRTIVGKDSDGTGDMNIGDTVQITNSSNNKTYQYNGYGNCIGDPTPLQPIDITSYISKGINNLTIRFIDQCTRNKTISSMYIVNKNTYILR